MWSPDLTVAAVCQQEDKFLLVEERSKSTGDIVYNQPAGHIEQGETIIEAVIRETLEETQRHFTPHGLLGLYRHEAENGKTYFRYTFIGTVSDLDTSFDLDSDIIRTHWLTLDQIKSNSQLRSPLVLACIEDFLAGTQYPLNMLREL